MNDLGLDDTEFAGDSDFHLEIPQNYLFWDTWVFVMYYIYIYGSVRAIPTYRVYRLYDTVFVRSDAALD